MNELSMHSLYTGSYIFLIPEDVDGFVHIIARPERSPSRAPRAATSRTELRGLGFQGFRVLVRV